MTDKLTDQEIAAIRALTHPEEPSIYQEWANRYRRVLGLEAKS